MEKQYLLSVDQSTQGTKALLFDQEGNLICRGDRPHRQIINDAGWVSHDLNEIYSNTLKVVRDVIEKAGIRREQVAGLGISNQRETSAVWDRTMSHHSAQDIAALSAIPNMRVYVPSDRFQTACLVKELLKDDKPAYIRVGRNAVEDIYEEGNVPFSMDKATVLSQGGDVAIIACGEMVKPALDAGRLLGESGISAGVVDMYCVKPLDEEAVQKAAGAARLVVTVEEHAPFGGLGSRVSQVVSACCPRMVVNLSLPDEPVITGTSAEVFEYYGLTGQGIARRVQELLRQL